MKTRLQSHSLLLLAGTLVAGNFGDQVVRFKQPLPPLFFHTGSSIAVTVTGGDAEAAPLRTTLESALQQSLELRPAKAADLIMEVRINRFQAPQAGQVSEHRTMNWPDPSKQTKKTLGDLLGGSCSERSVEMIYNAGRAAFDLSIRIKDVRRGTEFSHQATVSYAFRIIHSAAGKPFTVGQGAGCVFGKDDIVQQKWDAGDELIDSMAMLAALRARAAREVTRVCQRQEYEVEMRLSQQKLLRPLQERLIANRFAEVASELADGQALSCENGKLFAKKDQRADCLYTRALATEGAAYAAFTANPTPQSAQAVETQLTRAQADYQMAAGLDLKDRIHEDLRKEGRVTKLAASFKNFADYLAFLASPPPLPVVTVAPPPAPPPPHTESADAIAYSRVLRRDLAILRARPSVPESKAFLGEGRLIHHLLEADAQRVFDTEVKLFEERLERRELHLLKLRSLAPQGVLDAAATQRLQELENSLTLTPEEYTVNRAAVLKPVAKAVPPSPIAAKPKPLPVKPPAVPVTKPMPAPAATPSQVKPTGAKGFVMQMGTCDRIYMDQKLGSLRDALLGGRAADATLVTNEVRRRCGARTEQLAYFNAKAVEILAVREEPQPVAKTVAVSPYVTRKFALVVGIGKFKYRVNPLQFAAKDALDFAQVLRDPAIGRYIDSDTYVRVLTDEQATVENIRRAMDYLEKATEPSDLVTVFVSTHGTNPAMDSGDEDGRLGYIVAHDTDPTALSATAIPMRQVKEWLDSRLRAQRVALFMDTCYSGGIGQSKVGGKSLAPAFISGDSLRAVSQGNKALVVDEAPGPSARSGAPMDHGRTLIVSSLSSEQSWESATLGPPDHPGNSYFTYYLIDGLRKLTRPGHTPDVRELFTHLERYVGEDVRREKQASQTPQMYNPKGLRVGEPLN